MRPMTQKDQLLNQIELLQELYQAIERIELLESQLKAANVLISSYAKEVATTRSSRSSQETSSFALEKSYCTQPNKENARRGKKSE